MKSSLFQKVVTSPKLDNWFGFMIFWFMVMLDCVAVGILISIPFTWSSFQELTIKAVLVSIGWLLFAHTPLWNQN